jgi:hypothetical protein
MKKKVIVTHHAPDLDAVASCWLLKRFDASVYSQARVLFTNPGQRINDDEIKNLEILLEDVTYVDTGGGPFDHHDDVRAMQMVCGASLVYDYLCKKYPDLKKDLGLKAIIDHVNQVDHFCDVYWPEADNVRYIFMLAEIIRGGEFTYLNDDDSQLHFGLTCLDNVYASLKHFTKAEQILKTKGQVIEIGKKKVFAVETRNDDVLRVALKKGYDLAVRKDSTSGIVRMKVNPKSDLGMKPLYEEIIKVDLVGFWFCHPNNKILINGSKKNRDQKPTPLTLEYIVDLIKKVYK